MQRKPKNPVAAETPEVSKQNSVHTLKPQTQNPVAKSSQAAARAAASEYSVPYRKDIGKRQEIRPADPESTKDDAEVVIYKNKDTVQGFWSTRINESAMFAGAVICSILFLVLAILVRVVDVAEIGPEGTSVGFSAINQSIHELVGFNETIYEITQVLGYFALLVAAGWALAGFIQLIKRKKLFDVDMEILLLGCLFIVVIAFYAFFTFVAVNYRPVVMPGETEVEASFPSSHTMLLVTVMGSMIVLAGKYFRNSPLKKIIQIVSAALIAVMVVGRLLCGIHWFTDIIGGLLLSGALLMLYMGLLATFSKNGSN